MQSRLTLPSIIALLALILSSMPAPPLLDQAPSRLAPPIAAAAGVVVPFNTNSIWNQPIAANPTLVANSAQMIQQMTSNPWWQPMILPGVDQFWSMPVYQSDASTPRYRVCYPDGSYCADNVPVPTTVVIDPTGDGNTVIIDAQANPTRAWSFWRLQPRSGGGWTTESSGWGDITANGDGLHNFEGGQWGGRAAGWNKYAGLILPEEIRQGYIDHALVMSLPGEIVSPRPVWPAMAADGYSSSAYAIPEGSRIQLDPSLDVNSLPLTPGGRVIARALQTHGAWVGDIGGAIAVYAREYLVRDSSGNVRLDQSPWQGLLDGSDLAGLPMNRLRVVQVNQAGFYQNSNPSPVSPTPTSVVASATPTRTNTPTPIPPTATPTRTNTPVVPTATATRTNTPAVEVFQAQYFDGVAPGTVPAFTRTESRPIRHDWGSGRPDSRLGADRFSVRWTGTFNFEAGAYTFLATGDDGIRLWLDGTPVIDEWRDQNATTYRATRQMSAGRHTVRLEYYENTGGAVVDFDWVKGCPSGEYLAEYFNNRTLSGTATLARCESGVSYDWGSAGPGGGIGNDNFSVRWTGTFNFEAGAYTFLATGDDGVRLWLDGTPVITNGWVDQSPTTYQADVVLQPGGHTVRLEYYENTGGASIQFGWFGW